MISRRMEDSLRCGSAIREAYNEARRLSALYGPEHIFDLSLGNPSAPSPARVRQAILELGQNPQLNHMYMCDAGYEYVRDRIAQSLNRRFQAGCTLEQLVMSVGAAGGLNAVFYSLLDRDDEVILFRPYYPAYTEFIENWGGCPVEVPPEGPDFQPDCEELKKRITPRTKAVLVNSPHNPTGTIYTRETARNIAEVLESKQREYGHTIYLISDEPYRELIYDGSTPIWWPHVYPNTIVVYSFSKSLSLPGERIGYVLVSPHAEDCPRLIKAIRRATGCLGYVNAPAFFQQVIAQCLDEPVPLEFYRQNREMLYGTLKKLGFEAVEPRGTFYIWLKSPLEQEADFLERAKAHRLIFVGSSAFSWNHYVRVSFCGRHEMLERALPALAALAEDCGLQAQD